MDFLGVSEKNNKNDADVRIFVFSAKILAKVLVEVDLVASYVAKRRHPVTVTSG
jgi:hypothetical protein